MPIMPFPISRNSSIQAVESLFNSPAARPVLKRVLAEVVAGGHHDIARRILLGATDEEDSTNLAERWCELSAASTRAFRDIAQAWSTVGSAWLNTPDDGMRGEFDAEQLEKTACDQCPRAIPEQPEHGCEWPKVALGIDHLDRHWFDPEQPGFWWHYDGDPAPLIATSLLKALELAETAERDRKKGIPEEGPELLVPFHITWVCASPTFEVSISEVKADGQVVAISVTLSTPGTIMSLSHFYSSDDDSTNSEKNRVPDVVVDDDQWLFGQRAKRSGSTVVQDGQRFVFSPEGGGSDW